jgi:hypothetical protein
MRYEFTVDGSNDVFGQDETDATLAMRSIREAHAALNYMATDYGDWFESDGLPKSVVALRRQKDHCVVAEFRPRVYRMPKGGWKVRWTRIRATPGLITVKAKKGATK